MKFAFLIGALAARMSQYDDTYIQFVEKDLSLAESYAEISDENLSESGKFENYMNQLAKDGQKEEASQEEIMESLDNGPIPEEKSTPAGGVTMDMIHKSVPRSDIKFVDFAKMEPKVMSDKKNAILIDGQDIPMNQFFTEQDL